MFLNQTHPQNLAENLKDQLQDIVSNFDLFKGAFQKSEYSCDDYVASKACAKRAQEIEQKQTIVSLGLSEWR